MSERSHTVKGVRYVERPAPVLKNKEHICTGCAAFDGVRVDWDLCRQFPGCAAGAVREKIVLVVETKKGESE